MRSICFHPRTLSFASPSRGRLALPAPPAQAPSAPAAAAEADKVIESAALLIMKWNPDTSSYARVTSLFYESKREAAQFIACVNNLQKSMHAWASAASQAVRSLEDRVGTALLMRSTRSTSLTVAGAAFLEKVAPAFATIEDAAREAMGRAARPAGPLRVTMPRAAFDGVVAPVLATFRAACPDVELEIEVESRLVDIVEQGFDAGLRYGTLLAKEVTAFEAFSASESVLVASPSYLAGRVPATSPEDLIEHEAIVCRNRTTGLISPWLLASDSVSFRVDPQAPTVTGDLVTLMDLARDGHGVALVPVQCVARDLSDGRLARVLPGWASPLEPLFVYYPTRRGGTPALRAFVDHLRVRPRS